MARLMTGATAIIVLLCYTTASAAPRDEETFRFPPELEGRARIVKVQAPRGADPDTKAMDGLAEWEATQPSKTVVEVINDEAVARGVTAAGPEYEAVVFARRLDSGDGWFLDNTPGTVQWQRMIPGLGFEPSSDALSSFMARVEVSTYDPGDFYLGSGFTMELWDGDPLGVQDTSCSAGGVPAPIPGTTCTFSNLPEAAVYDLKCVFPAEVTIPGGCDRVFGAVWPGDVCRWAWRLADHYISGGAPPPPELGDGGAFGMAYACEQFGECATPSGYNAGTCCETGEACDHADPDPANWTPEGGCTWWEGLAMHPTFCQDEAADYFYAITDHHSYPYYNNFVSQLSARTDVIMQVVPMSVDIIPGTGPLPPDVTISGNTVTIDQAYPGGERHLWFEIFVSDWDPGDTGTTVKAWQGGLDASGYSAGLECTLEPWKPACITHADCIAAQGPIGDGILMGGCDYWGEFPSFRCYAGFVDEDRADFIFAGQVLMGGVDHSTWNYRYGATLLGAAIPSPHIGDMYTGTLTLKTSCDCPAGDFSVGMMLPNAGSNMVDGDSQFIPLLGVVGADISFPTGQCCNISEDPTACISDTVTRCECEQMGIDGGFYTSFNSALDCADDCCGCLDDEVCGDGDACTVNRCVDCRCEAIPVEIAPDECCNDVPYHTGADIGGLGAIASNDDGDPCTDNLCDDAGGCDLGDHCGVPYNPPAPAGTTCFDGEPCLTVNDECDGTGNCVGTDILSVPCASSADCDSITFGIGGCNLLTNFCQCTGPFCGNGIVESGETCDDGNPDNGDGCSSTCTVEDGWNCSGYPSVCTPVRVPTVSKWGLIVMTLMLAAGAKVYFNHRRSARA